MNERQELYAIMRALLEITEDNWVIIFENGMISLNNDTHGKFIFSNIYEVKDFMHKNFNVIGHRLLYIG